jgi:hypothetical protein
VIGFQEYVEKSLEEIRKYSAGLQEFKEVQVGHQGFDGIRKLRDEDLGFDLKFNQMDEQRRYDEEFKFKEDEILDIFQKELEKLQKTELFRNKEKYLENFNFNQV